jgi:hypothetical protein
MKGWQLPVLLVVGLAGACTSREKSPAAETGAAATPSAAPATAAAPAETSAAVAAAADTTAAALWTRLNRENYQRWALWPGKGKLYKGQEPHGALLTTYVNPLAQDGLTNGAAHLAPGSIIVKENYGPNKELMAVTVMQKVAGYDPPHLDWFWAKYQPGGKVEMAGRVAMCSQCHQGASDHDDLWTLQIAKTGKRPPPMKM